MGFFSRKPESKTSPIIEFGGIQITYQSDHEWWDFTCEGVNFVSYGPEFKMPSKDELNRILAEVVRLTPEMKSRLTEGWKATAGAKINDGEEFLIDLTELDKEGTYEVSWSGGSLWGDMGIEFVIQNDKIVDEVWGD